MAHIQKLSKFTFIKKELVNDQITNAFFQYEKKLTKRALYKTSDVNVSEDLVQSTFLKTLLYLQKGGEIVTMSAFLNHVLNNLVIDEYRKRKTVSLDVLREKGFDSSIDYTDCLIDTLDGEKMVLLIDQLPNKYKLVIKMRYLKGLSLQEISIITNQTINTVSAQSCRGLKMLAKL